MNRRNMILCALLALQLVLVLIIYWPGKAGHTKGVTLIDVQPEKVASIVISDGYGSSLTLTKQEDGWVIDPPENYPADPERIKSVLHKISHIEAARLVSTSKGSQGRLMVSDEKFNRRLKLIDKNGREQVLYLGTTQGRGVYARSSDSDDVMFVNRLSSWEFATSPRSWWKSSVADVSPDALNQVEITNSNGTFKIHRDSKDMWVDASGNVLDQDKVKRLLLSVKNIRVSEYLSKKTDKKLDKTDAVLKLVPAKGSPIILEIGPEEKSERLVRASTDSHLLKVQSSELKQVLEAKVQNLKAEQKPKDESKAQGDKQDETAKGE